MERAFPPRRLLSLPLPRPSPAAVGALAFGAALVTYGNIVSALPKSVTQTWDWAFILGGFVGMLLSIGWAVRLQGLPLAEIGLAAHRLGRSALVGLAVGAVVILPVVLYFIFPVGVPGGSIDYEGAKEATLGSFLVWALVRQPLGTSIFEETMFRGILQGLSVQAFNLWRGLLVTALAFALWHIVINYRTVQETNASQGLVPAVGAQVASMLGLMVGSLFLSLLRHWTGNLAAPIAFHWVVVVAIQGTLFALSR